MAKNKRMSELNLNLHEEIWTDQNGHKRVILNFDDYQRLKGFLEDLYDLQTIEKRKNEPLIPHDQFVKLLKEDGLL